MSVFDSKNRADKSKDRREISSFYLRIYYPSDTIAKEHLEMMSMSQATQYKALLAQVDLSDQNSILSYARHLEDMTFREVLDLDIKPADYNPKTYNSAKFKGGMGNLIEERYFGYKSNSDQHPDFAEAGVELKATCYDIRKKNREPSAGERLVLTMIPFDKPIEPDLTTSHLWEKCSTILLVYYQRDRSIDKYDQQIKYVKLFTPPEEDLKVIRDDYNTIVSYIQSGRAHELSEGLTTYLGACTKGANLKHMWADQYYPYIEFDGSISHPKAKKRAFSFKRQYMDYVLHHYMMDEQDDSESISDVESGASEPLPLEEMISRRVTVHIGKSDKQIALEFGTPYTGKKAQWITLAYRMLGVGSNRVKEFVKAGISARAIRVEENGDVEQSLSLDTFEFADIANEPCWEASELRQYLEETRFFFVVFKKTDGEYRLAGCKFWNMPVAELDTNARRCWQEAHDVICSGVKITRKGNRFFNNLPGESDNPTMHVRPKSQHRAYRFEDGTAIGDLKDASPLPDGRYMTRQCFWINNGYVIQQISDLIE